MNTKAMSALFIGMMINTLFAGINIVDIGANKTSFSLLNEEKPKTLDNTYEDFNCFIDREKAKQTNYDSIPVTRAPPDAPVPKGYEPVIAEPFNVQKVYTTAGLVRSINKIYVLVTSSVYSSLESRLLRYASDLERWTTYTAVIYQGSWSTPENVRAFLQGELANGMVGVLLVGDIPAAWFEIENDYGEYGYASFPIDLFYADLDGNWVDAQTTSPMRAGVYDDHTGTVAPDIFVGRLKASGLSAGTEVALLQNYFDKNHAYRIGMLALPHKALVYIDDDWIPWANEWSDNVGVVYSNRTLVKDAATTNAADYKNRLTQDYEWIHLAAHSTATGHALAPGSVSYSDITNIDPHCLFYNLFCCSAARYTETNCIGSTYIFTNTYGLGVVGSTKTGGMLNLNYFYDPLETKTIGESFKDWFTASGESDRSWFYGMTVLGDITLKPKQKPAGVTINTPNGNEIWAGGATKWINFTISGGEAPYICWINYSTDGGNTWYVHNASNVSQAGTYNWSFTVWYANSTSCRVNITLQNTTDLWMYDISDANFTIDSTLPTSNIEPNFPYCWNKPPPLLITATASDIISGVKEVELWYRYSQNNVSWSSWGLFSIDKNVPWQWNFTFPNGKGYYELYTKAMDEAENYEIGICVLTSCYAYSLTFHLSIYINNNNFTSTNGVVCGTGTLEDPYIIENWYITAETVNGINIENTDAYFIIRNCIICDGKNNDKMGICFRNVKNGKIENVTSYNNYIGIALYTSSNNEIINCSFYYNSYSIFLYGFGSNGEYINITTNQIYNNSYGIWQSYFLNTKIHYNNIYNNTNYGIYNYNSEIEYQANATNNWWGSTSGPSGIGSSSGNAVSSNVLCDPWLAEPYHSPLIIIIQPEEGLITNQDVSLEYMIDVPLTSTGNPIAVNIDGPPNGTIYSSEGEYNITIIVTDGAGNTATTTISFTIDKTDPTITVTGVADSAHYNVNVTPVITMDEAGILEITLNDVYFESGTEISVDGVYYLNVTGVDLAGNTATKNVVFTVDKTPPVANAGLDREINEDEGLELNASLAWDNMGITNWTWSFVEQGKEVFLYGEIVYYTFIQPGIYVIILNVSDAASNWDTDEVIITVKDVTNPVADAGSDKTVDEDMTVTFDGSGSTDNVGVVNYTWAFVDGTLQILYGISPTYTFNTPGTYVVTLNMSDAAGNWAVDVVNITVKDIAQPEISNVHGLPSAVMNTTGDIVFWSVCISCQVTDNFAVSIVKVNITGPIGFTPINATMKRFSATPYTYELYEYGVKNLTAGTYSYHIWANDTTGNENKSTKYHFVIPITVAGFVDNRKVNVIGVGNGTLNITLVVLPQPPPENLKNITCIEVTITGELTYINITIKYSDEDVVGLNELTLRMYYWDDSQWQLCNNTGIDTDKNIVWANVTHLTIFAPMAEKVGVEAAPGLPYILLLYMAIAIVIVVLIVGISLKIVSRRKPKEELKPKTLRPKEIVEKRYPEVITCDYCNQPIVIPKERPPAVRCHVCGKKITLK